MKALVTARIDREILKRLDPYISAYIFDGYGVNGEKLSEETLIKVLEDIDIAIVEFEPFTAAVLAASPQLKVIACCRNEPGANIDEAEARSRGISLFSTPGRNAIAVAEYTFGLMISISRKLYMSHYLLRYTDELTAVNYHDKTGDRSKITSEWSLDPGAPFQRFSGPELYGKKIGIVGFGLIGREIALRALGFGMEILIYDPYITSKLVESRSAKLISLEDLMSTADFVVIAAKVTERSQGLITSDLLKKMKPTSYFINTARASLVDYPALIEVLQQKNIAGAALDVYEIEPLPQDSPLRDLDNVILSPHLAGATHEVPVHHTKNIVDQLENFFKESRRT